MRQIEQYMHLQAADEQIKVIEPEEAPCRQQRERFDALCNDLLDTDTPHLRQQTLMQQLQALSSPRLMTVWFNAW